MDIKKLQEPLKAEQIEFRVQSVVSDGKAVIILAYKNARVDMERLDEAVWPMRRKREHTRDNKNCIVSIWDEETKQWISKEDTGTESTTEKEKGLASDSFKRACFNWGIGRELYDFPFIYINTVTGETKQDQGKWKTTNKLMKDWKRTVDHTNWISVTARDKTGKVRFWDGAVDVPETPKTQDDDKPRFNDSNFDNLVDAIWDGKVSYATGDEALQVIKAKYKVSKKMQETVLAYFK